MAKKETRVVVASVPDEGGTLSISETVLAEIAVTEAAATEGIVLGREAGRKGKERPAMEAVTVRLTHQEAAFHLTVGVRAGVRMPEAADALRQRIASAVLAKTGYTVRAVDVLVDRVVREPAAEKG
jgi:uncharacterized alkaline shock family protein YloU